MGLGRLMATIVEVSHDKKGIIWPKSVAPFEVHLINIAHSAKCIAQSEKIYKELQKNGIEVLYDDREDVSAGEKFADADLIGIPVRLIISEKTKDKIEWCERDKKKIELLSLSEIGRRLQ
jgi:prolyl-tRNA synthetase